MSFDQHFSLLTGHQPFGWQARLGRQLLDSRLPEVIDIPTGLGKTSVMALWLIALARGATLPRRLVYVVDRRAVVDQATRFAERLRANMPGQLANALNLGHGSGRLPISTLRGGFADNRKWLENPSKPAIVVGTIDMVGSRLLFEGYGVSRRMRPYHAGLLGVDTLVLLDEAHLCPPFEALLRQIVKERDGKFGSAPDSGLETPAFRLTSLSATGREQPDLPPGSVFSLNPADHEEHEVRMRLKANKRLRVTELTDPKILARRLADLAVRRVSEGRPARIVVYCDRRVDAVAVKSRIDAACLLGRKSGKIARTGHQSELLVGERRVYERTSVESWLTDHGFLGSSCDRPDVPRFLVATSAGEVGVDLCADHMVCDLVSWERTVQRLGRVNRRGEVRTSLVDVLAIRPVVKPAGRKATRVKAENALETLRAHRKPLDLLVRGPDDRYDASPHALMTLKREHRAVVDAATTAAPLRPELTRPLLDAWSMTSLKRHEGRPEVAPWLRGWDTEEPHTNVVWRRHLPCIRSGSGTTANPQTVTEFFQAAPIHLTERLEARSSRVMDWLLDRSAEVSKRDDYHELAVDATEIVAILLDHAGEHLAATKLSELQWLAAPAKVLSEQERRQRSRRRAVWTDRLLPGATLVVDSRICGLRDGLLDEKCESEAASADADEGWQTDVADNVAEAGHAAIGFRVEEVTTSDDGEGLIAPQFPGWQHIQTFETHPGQGGVVRSGLAVFRSAHDPTTEDSRSVVTAPQPLRDHAVEVERRARELALRLKLADEEVEAITLAARFHDNGKTADRWQEAMNAPPQGRPYAKTSRAGNLRLLEGYRHEFGSLLLAEREDLPEGIRDLVLHLIAAHHGWARPLIRHDGWEVGLPSLLESKAGDVALRFACLQRRYGPWGLAWREAILRAADQWASRPHNPHDG